MAAPDCYCRRMKKPRSAVLLTVAVLFGTFFLTALLAVPAAAQTVLSRFEGSVEKGVYQVDYGSIAYTRAAAREPQVERVEGALVSRIFVKPEDKTNLEVFRSYQQELQAAGFAIHLAAESASETELAVRALYDEPHTPSFDTRAYRGTEGSVGRGDLARVGTQADYYLVASRASGAGEHWVAVLICKNENLYMVEELTTAAMETGTVTLDLDRLRSAMEESGRIAVYDIHFATGSAEIEPESADALSVIASYLGETEGGYYIVGHTDDTGTLEGNLTLSEQRAAAVKQALVNDYGVDAARLETRGVGPLAPVSTNTGDAGRALNRRVEIVQRLR
jgi:outer membrane protein OmpA-like peptidoglycan-associated protein